MLQGTTFTHNFTNLTPFTFYGVGVAILFVGAGNGIVESANVTTLEDGKYM